MGEDNKKLELAVPGEWALQKAFGPVLDELGEDLKRLYAAGRDRILAAAFKKVEDINDGKRANLRVTRDALWNGAVTESEVCAEYFGGIMASSRSEDGKDDSAVQFVDAAKSLSSKQLGLHYVIYNRLNKLWVSSGTRVNVAMSTDMDSRQVYFGMVELVSRLELNVDTDLNILYRHGLLSRYSMKQHIVGQKSLPYVSANPTTFGVLLYAAAHNRLGEWRLFDRVDFGDFEGIELPRYYCDSLQALAIRAGLADEVNTEQDKTAIEPEEGHG